MVSSSFIALEVTAQALYGSFIPIAIIREHRPRNAMVMAVVLNTTV
jgi:hypothetical protein